MMATEKETHEIRVQRLQKIVDYILIILKAFGVTPNKDMFIGKHLGEEVRMFMQNSRYSPVGFVIVWWGNNALSIGYDRITSKVKDTSRWTDDGKHTETGGLMVSYSRIASDPEFLFDLINYLVLVPFWKTEPSPGHHS